MKIKHHLSLRKVGRNYIIVDTSDKNVEFTDVYTLNGTAAFLWQKIGDKEFTPEMLAKLLCEEYEVDEATALRDVNKLLNKWKVQGLVIE